MVDLSLDGIDDALNKGLDVAQPALFGLGFVWGASEGQVSGAQTTNLAYRITTTLSNLGLGGITVAPGYTSTSSFKFKPTGFINKGLAAAIGAWVYKEAKLPYAKEIYKAVYPFGVGYSIGGFFDPHTSPAQQPVVGGGPAVRYVQQIPYAGASSGLMTAPVVS